jgi:hypothetical protein
MNTIWIVFWTIVGLWLLIGTIRVCFTRPGSAWDLFLEILLIDLIGEVICAILENGDW